MPSLPSRNRVRWDCKSRVGVAGFLAGPIILRILWMTWFVPIASQVTRSIIKQSCKLISFNLVFQTVENALMPGLDYMEKLLKKKKSKLKWSNSRSSSSVVPTFGAVIEVAKAPNKPQDKQSRSPRSTHGCGCLPVLWCVMNISQIQLQWHRCMRDSCS